MGSPQSAELFQFLLNKVSATLLSFLNIYLSQVLNKFLKKKSFDI